MKIERFEDIEAWQLARELIRIFYALTMNPDFAKDFGLRNQIRDAAGSSMHNIAEGFDFESNKEVCPLSAVCQAFMHRSAKSVVCGFGSELYNPGRI